MDKKSHAAPKKLYLRYREDKAEAGGFEPPVRLPVRQFSKLLVSATHPNFQMWFLNELAAKIVVCFQLVKEKGRFSRNISTFVSF